MQTMVSLRSLVTSFYFRAYFRWYQVCPFAQYFKFEISLDMLWEDSCEGKPSASEEVWLPCLQVHVRPNGSILKWFLSLAWKCKYESFILLECTTQHVKLGPLSSWNVLCFDTRDTGKAAFLRLIVPVIEGHLHYSSLQELLLGMTSELSGNFLWLQAP